MKKFLCLLFISTTLHAQEPDLLFRGAMASAQYDSSSLGISFRNTNFFRNNEYFNPLYKGYTLLGFNAEPRLVWQADAKTNISAGALLIKYDGREGFSKVLPVFSLTYNPVPRFSVTMGTLQGAGEHRLPESLYGVERNLNQVVEDGIQLRYVSQRIFSDIWLQWDHFLWWGDNDQERLTFGISTDFLLTPENQRWWVRVPLRLLATHRGGQIDNSDAYIQTLFHLAPALCTGYKTNGRYIRDLGIDFNFIQFVDASPTPQLPMTKGYAFFPDIALKGSFFDVMAGIWEADGYYAPKGDPMYWSISYTGSDYIPRREMLVTRLNLHHKVSGVLNIELRGETYYDTRFKKLDYSYSLFMVFGDSWLLKKNAENYCLKR